MEQCDQGLFFALKLNGNGGATSISWPEIRRWQPQDGPIWIHLDRTDAHVQTWLRQESGLTMATVDALLTEETRPRMFKGKRGTVAILRGVNLNPGARQENMVDLRIWSEGKRVITLRRTRLQTVRDVQATLTRDNTGPETIPDLFSELVTRLIERMSPTIEGLQDRVDQVAEGFELGATADTRNLLMDIRNQAVALRRYLAPQRIALNEMVSDPPDWAEEDWVPRMRDAADTLTYYVEELDYARDQALVIKDDIASRTAEATNRTLYALAVISGVFLPLAFLTGLLGINVGGMPGVENKSAFWIFCGLLVGLGAFEVVLFKKLKWI